MRLPARHLQECGTFPVLTPVCPERIPFVEAKLRRARAFRSGKDHVVFYSEWSGPYPGMSPRNSPPRFAHLVIHAGDLSHALPFDWPKRATALPNPIPSTRRRPVLLETVTWFGIQGQLVLAPSFPTGGIDGDHLIFRWSEDGLDYAITLHAWTPLAETIAALREVVGTIPRKDNA